jgi:hypothetical protein
VRTCGTALMSTVGIGGLEVPRLILGHLPFMGESYQGPLKNAEYSRRFSDPRNVMSILERAVREYGITVMSAPTTLEGEPAGRFLGAVQKVSVKLRVEIGLIVCLKIPLLIGGKQVDDYRRWLTYYDIEKRHGEEELLRRYLSDPVLQARKDWESNFLEELKSSSPYKQEFATLEVDFERAEKALTGLRNQRVLFIELGSEADFISMGDRLDLICDLVDWITEEYGFRCLCGCHHAGSTIPILEASKTKFCGYVTPANKLGVMMFPTQQLSESAIRQSTKPMIAIKPFAGGRIHPKPALEYVYSQLGIPCCMIGVGSEEELEQDSSAALQILSGNPHETC